MGNSPPFRQGNLSGIFTGKAWMKKRRRKQLRDYEVMTMKFVHIADVHWGMSPDSDKPWSKERAQDIKDTFANRHTGGSWKPTACLFPAIYSTASRWQGI